jgi:catechol 2,3-dioxygenase-like lactoylglutathione lyase family enzyme
MGLKVAVDFREEGEFIDTVQDLTGVKLHMIKLSAPDGSVIELLHDVAHPTESHARDRLCDAGIRHIAFTVADVKESWRALSKHGCQVLSSPTTSPDGKARLFFARDPEGNLIEIVQMLP